MPMSATIEPCPLPATALLARYQREGGYTDCYSTVVDQHVPHAAFVQAFYSTALFRMERWILSWLVKRPSDDAQVRELAAGRGEAFAAWTVEARGTDQLLLCDFQGRTRSWLMVTPGDHGRSTRLYFGSAVVPRVDRRTGRSRMGWGFHALLGFHRLYSRALLRAAQRRLQRQAAAGTAR